MNGLLDSYYTQTPLDTGGPGRAATVGAQLGVNVGSELVRVQVSIVGLLLAGVVVILLLHRAGNRFSTHVG